MKKKLTLAEFIEAERARRHMGVNEFARLCKVNHSLITRHSSKTPPHPTLEFLRKLSKGTGVALANVLQCAYPELAEETKVDPQAEMLARRIMQFGQHTRDVLIGIIESFEERGNNQ